MPNEQNKVSEEQWERAKDAAIILEQKIAALVDEFETTHSPIQCNVMTRWRTVDDKYNIKKGGACQIKLHDCSAYPDLPVTMTSEFRRDYIREIEYAEGMD